MKKFKWKSALSVNIWFLRLVGLWPGAELYKLNNYTFYMIFVFLFYNSHLFFQTANVLTAYRNLQTLTTIIFSMFSKLLTCVKMLIFIRKSGILHRLMLQIESEELQPKNDQQLAMVRPLFKAWKIMYFMFCVPVLCIVVFRTIFPILDGTVKNYRLPFPAWYPYDYKKTPFYQITYLHQVICVWISGIVTVNMDMFIAALMVYICTQCIILSDNIRSLTNCGDGEFNRKLVDCIEHHKKIVKYEDDSNQFDLRMRQF
jgi:hypothetical protein